MDQPVQVDGSPSGLEEGDHRVLPAAPLERAEAYITRMDRHQRGVQPPGRRLRGHDANARRRGHSRQPGDVHHDRGYRAAEGGLPLNPGGKRHRLAILTGRHPHGIDPGDGPYPGGARRAGNTTGDGERQGSGEGLAEGGASVRVAGSEVEEAWRRPVRKRLCSPQDPRQTGEPFLCRRQ